MALPPAGVRLVAEDANKFDSALKTAGSVLDGFGKTATSVAGAVNSAFSGMASAVGNALRPLGKLFEQIFVSVIRSVVNDAIHQLERFAASVIQAAIKGSELETSISRLGFTLDKVANSAFAPFVNQLSQMVNKAAPAFLGVVQAAESYLGGLGQSALVWGENFINQFAQGMWNAVGQILQVLTDVANMISYWLSPGSPPRILPELDQWGTAAANEFFGGWLKADFGIFNELGGTLTNLIRSIPLPSGNQGDVISRILGTRQGIAAAVEELRTTGTIATSTIDAITAAVGTSDASVRAYLESMVRLQAANETVRQAQEELNRVTAEYEALLRPINDEIAGITEEQQQLADEQRTSLLQLVLQDPNATASEKRQAALEIERLDAERRRRALLAEQAVAVEGAQDQLDAAKTAQELAQEDFNNRRALITMQTEQNNLLREQLRLMEALARGGSIGAGAGPKPPVGGAGKLGINPFDIEPFNIDDLIPSGIQERWQAFTNAVAEAWEQMIARFQPAIDVWNNDVIPAWEGLVKAFEESKPDIIKAIAAIVGFTTESFRTTLPAVFRNLTGAIEALTQIWKNHSKAIIGTITIMSMAVVTIINVLMTTISGIITLALQAIAGAMDIFSAAFRGDWEGVKTAVTETVRTMMRTVLTTITGVLGAITLFLGPALEVIGGFFTTQFAAIRLVVDTVMPAIGLTITTIFNNIRNNVIQPLINKVTEFGQALIDLWDWIQNHVFHIDLPDIPGTNTSGSGGGMSMGPSPTNTSGNPVYNTSNQGPTYNYSPTYQGTPPSPQHDFTVMAVFSSAV